MTESRLGFPGADDPAYAHEHEALAASCRDFLQAHERGDFDAMLFATGQITAHCAALWLLSPPGGILDPATMFARPGERVVREEVDSDG